MTVKWLYYQGCNRKFLLRTLKARFKRFAITSLFIKKPNWNAKANYEYLDMRSLLHSEEFWVANKEKLGVIDPQMK